MDFEICTDNYEAVLYASKLNFKRVELCTALELGGLTPSIGLIEKCCEISDIETHVILRPRTGNFNYSDKEMQQMEIDIKNSIEAGASGIVIGVLNENNEIALKRNAHLLGIAKKANLEITFHRAFDFTSNYHDSVNQIIELGFNRILSSGLQPTAEKGVEILSKMVKQAQGKIEIMAGSGVNSNNAKLISETGVNALHFTARRAKTLLDPLNMGLEYEIDKEKIQGILKAI